MTNSGNKHNRKAGEAPGARQTAKAPLEERWSRIARKLNEAAAHLRAQGAVVRRRGAGRDVWVVRFRARGPDGARLRSIYVGGEDEPELVRRARRLLAELRAPSLRRREIDMFARCVRAAKTLMNRLTGL
jgi:hypothetical protein